jgi:hypothetical protein
MKKKTQSEHLATLTRMRKKLMQYRYNELCSFSDTKILNLSIRNNIDISRHTINIAKKANIWYKSVKPAVISEIIKSEYK